ncbi:MAG: HDOD domain-containing protein [Methylococcales bacterium]|nr:HDOD domain-containing protein [Methylococcales bacterium]
MNTDHRALQHWSQRLQDQDMPIFSDTAEKIRKFRDDDVKSAMDLASMIINDPNLTAQILRLSNSPYYNPSRQKILTISRAIVVLGWQLLYRLTLACSFFESILPKAKTDRVHQEIGLAIHAAVQAKAMAVANKDSVCEEIFIAALLHRIGHISFWCFSEHEGEKIHQLILQGLSAEEAEHQVLGFTLKQLNQTLISAWELGGLIEAAAADKKSTHPHQVEMVLLGHDLTQVLQQGKQDKDYQAIIDRLSRVLNSPKSKAEKFIENNTELAVQLASRLGAEQAAKAISHLDSSNAASALTRPDSEQAPDHHVIRLHLLQEIGQLLVGGVDINLLLETILEGLQRGLDMDRSLFAVLTPDRSKLVEKSVMGWRKPLYQSKLAMPVITREPNLLDTALTKETGLLINPDNNPEQYHPVICKTLGRHECLVMAIRSNDKPIGLMYCDRAYRTTPVSISQEDYQSFCHFVQQANIGLALYRNQARKSTVRP